MFLTITLNPSIDKIVTADKLIIGDTNRVKNQNILAAGKGVDVAKMLGQLDCPVAAAGFLGHSAYPVFKKMFVAEGITDIFTPIEGETRTNIHLIDGDNNRTELLESGPAVTLAEWEDMCASIEKILPSCRAVALCGSVPPGVTREMYLGLIKLLKGEGRIVAVDTSGKLLEAAINEGVDFIKPNRLEIAQLMGKDDVSVDEIIDYCTTLLDKKLGSALVSLGGEGALYLSKQGIWQADAPKIEVKSTLGCGDTMVASSLVSMANKEDGAILLKKASALAAANAANAETARFDPEVYTALLGECHVIKLR